MTQDFIFLGAQDADQAHSVELSLIEDTAGRLFKIAIVDELGDKSAAAVLDDANFKLLAQFVSGCNIARQQAEKRRPPAAKLDKTHKE